MTEQIPEPTKEQLEWFETWYGKYLPEHIHAGFAGFAIFAAHYKRQYDALKAAYDAAPVAWVRWYGGKPEAFRFVDPPDKNFRRVRLVPDPVDAGKEC